MAVLIANSRAARIPDIWYSRGRAIIVLSTPMDWQSLQVLKHTTREHTMQSLVLSNRYADSRLIEDKNRAMDLANTTLYISN